MAQSFRNETGGRIRVRGEVVEPGKSVEVEGDKLPGSLRLIAKGAAAAKDGDTGPERREERREPRAAGADAPEGKTATGGAAKPADKG